MSNQQQIEALVFKKVAGGYVYRAPNPWLFGKGRHYLVSEAQKEEIAEILKLKWPLLSTAIVMAFIVVAGAASGVAAWGFFRHQDLGFSHVLLILALFIVSVFIALTALNFVRFLLLKPKLEPILMSAQRTNERISLREMRQGARTQQSLRDLIRTGALNAFVCACSMFNVGLNLGSTLSHGHGTMNLYLLGFLSILSGWIAFTNLRKAMKRAQLAENPG